MYGTSLNTSHALTPYSIQPAQQFVRNERTRITSELVHRALFSSPFATQYIAMPALSPTIIRIVDVPEEPLGDQTQIEQLLKQAKSGDPKSQYEYARRLHEQSNPDNPLTQEVLHWVQLAANKNHPDALYSLGQHTSTTDKNLGFQYIQQAAKLGCAAAQFSIWLDFSGKGQYLHYLHLSAKAGYPDALFALGQKMFQPTKNLEDTLYYFRQAAIASGPTSRDNPRPRYTRPLFDRSESVREGVFYSLGKFIYAIGRPNIPQDRRFAFELLRRTGLPGIHSFTLDVPPP